MWRHMLGKMVANVYISAAIFHDVIFYDVILNFSELWKGEFRQPVYRSIYSPVIDIIDRQIK